MSQFTDREIQDLFTEAEKYALANQFPENTLNATNENVLSPPEDAKAEEDEENEAPKQELEPVAAKGPEPAPVAPAPEIKPVQEKIEPDDGMLNQSDIDALIRATAPPAPAVVSPPPPSVAAPEVVPPPLVNVQTSEQDEIMSADDIEALIRDAQAPTIAAAPMPSSETVAPQAETQSILHSSMEPDDDAPLSPEQIAALVEAANATTMDSDQDAVLSHDDIQALIAKTHKEIQVSTKDLFDTKESEIRIPEPTPPAPPVAPVAPVPKVTPAPARSVSIGLETASQLDTETDAILSQSDLAEMMRKANLETESVKPAAVRELVADTYSADLEELIKKLKVFPRNCPA
jgi:tartrate dehydratase beta subunit/fumarate hydratase class I family protein